MKWNNAQLHRHSSDTIWYEEKKHLYVNFHATEPLCLDLWKSNRIKNLLQSSSWFYWETQEGRHYFCVSPSPQCPITISCWAFRCPLSPSIFKDCFLRKPRCQDGVGVSIKSDVSRRWARKIRHHGNVQITYGGSPFDSVHDKKRNFYL